MRRLLLICILGAILVPGASFAGEPIWKRLLRDQLHLEQQCNLKTVSAIVRDETSNSVLMARVTCLDGRLFDIERARPHQKFTIRSCEVSVC